VNTLIPATFSNSLNATISLFAQLRSEALCVATLLCSRMRDVRGWLRNSVVFRFKARLMTAVIGHAREMIRQWWL